MREPSSTTLALLFFVTHMFRMSLFFLIAGFFGRMLIERKGTRAFIRDRGRRILLPLVVGLPVILLLFGALGGLGFLLGGMSWSDLLLLQAQQQSAQSADTGGFPWAHLWFLYYLLLFYTGGAHRPRVRESQTPPARLRAGSTRAVRFCLGGIWGAAAIGLLLAAYFYNLDHWPSWTGLPAPLILAPHPPSVIAYGTAFAFGWLAHRQTDRFLELEQRWLSFIVLAVALTIGSLYIGGITPRFEGVSRRPRTHVVHRRVSRRRMVLDPWSHRVHRPLFLESEPGQAIYRRRFVLALLDALAGASRSLPPGGTRCRGTGRSITRSRWARHFVVLFVSYRYLVRSTFIGATLNGRRYPGR